MERKFSYSSMGTTWEITVWDEVDDQKFLQIQDDVIEMSHQFDNKYSRFIKTSFVWELASKTGVVEVPQDFMNMLKLYFQFYLPSEKKLNPLIGFTISDLGYDADYSLITKNEIRKTPDLDSAVKIIDDSHIEIKQNVLFDLGALGKGYFVDVIANYLRSKSLKHFLVNGSGDVAHSGPTPIKVGLEHPLDTSKVIGTIEMQNICMCSSGTNRRKWGNYNHMIDPQTNTSPQEIVATWITSSTTAVADGLATALFLVPPENFTNIFDFEYCVMNQKSQVKRSPGFNAVLF